MTATYTLNAELNGIEITFPGKPAQNIIDSLKSVGYRWHKVKALWYAKQSKETLALAQSIANGADTPLAAAQSKPALPIDTPESRAAYEAEVDKVWDRKNMRDFCRKESLVTVLLHSGIVFSISKRKIETDFCFGYSSCGQGPEHSEAIKEADKARESEAYFIRENLRPYTDMIHELDLAKDPGSALPRFPILCKTYEQKSENLFSVHVYDWNSVERSFSDGINAVREHKGERVTGLYNTFYIPTAEDLEIIRAAYQKAADLHEKKVRAYLKRYGLSKLHVWTYWLDD